MILQTLEYYVTLLVILSILVIAHEWGHFIVARLFSIRVDDFSIGFGKRLVRLGKRGDTEYNLRMWPLGGFVKIAGMEADEEPLLRARDKILSRGAEPDPNATQLPLMAENADEDTREATAEAGPDGFNSKPLWQRALVILAGPVMSFLLGYVVLCLMGWTVGLPTGQPTNKVAEVEAGGEGQRIGLQAGDVIQAIDGVPITSADQMVRRIYSSPNRPLVLTIGRDGHTLTRTAIPRPATDETGKPISFVDAVQPGDLAVLGVQPGDTLAQIDDTPVTGAAQALTRLRQDAGKAVTLDIQRGIEHVTLQGTLPARAGQMPALVAHPHGILKFSPASGIRHLGLLDSIAQGNQITGRFFSLLGSLLYHRQLGQQTTGIIGMYSVTKVAVKNGPPGPVFLLAQISISLAIFNLLPIPILDGGHLLTFFIEWIRRGKKMTAQQQQAFLMTGLAIIGTIFVLVMTKDILRTIRHQMPQ